MANKLDLAFALDCTGSMGSYIDSAKRNIKSIVQQITRTANSDIRFALVEYKDHPPQDETFITKVHDFSSDTNRMQTWLSDAYASGGGDINEAVADALEKVTKLSWRQNVTKVAVIIADAPPHGISADASGDGFPNGCPLGIDPMRVMNNFVDDEIILYTIGCEPSIDPYKDWFMAISQLTGGQYVPMTDPQRLTEVIVGGAREEMSLRNLMERVNNIVLNEQENQPDGIVNRNQAIMRVYEELQGTETVQLWVDRRTLDEDITEMAERLAGCPDMNEIRYAFKMNTERCARGNKSYEVKTGRLTKGQARRMVQKSLRLNNCNWDP